ncbi:MAG: glycerate kinase [Hydrogenophilus sp.]|nr:glycerate kinase [Hydrogenophilus sp.]
MSSIIPELRERGEGLQQEWRREMAVEEEVRERLLRLFKAAVASADPRAVLPPWVERLARDRERGETVVVGAGKAAAAMAQVFEEFWPEDRPLRGVVVTRVGHLPPDDLPKGKRRIRVLEGGHPIPTKASARAGEALLAAVQGLRAEDRVVVLLSGGASALTMTPPAGVSLRVAARVTERLLAAGASVDEVNCVRKHLSRVGGGRLAAAAFPAEVVTLAISDVAGDDPSVIGSGPTVADPTSCAEALAVLERYGVVVPEQVRGGLMGGEWETPKPGDGVFARCQYCLVATPWGALQAAAAEAERWGVRAYVLGDDWEGEAREVGRVMAAIARGVARRGSPFAPPCVLLSGGETTVRLQEGRRRRSREKGEGVGAKARGGPNGEFLLGLALALQGEGGVWALAADSDGIDGSEGNAGAVVTPTTLARAAALGIDARRALSQHDSWGFFAALGDLVETGPTLTNVNDFRAVWVGAGCRWLEERGGHSEGG